MIFAALFKIESMCECHIPFLLNVNHKCLWLSMNWIWVPSDIKLAKISKCFQVKGIASVIDGLNLISHWCQDITIERSWLILPSMSCMLAAEQNRELSSANNLAKLSNCSAIS